MAEGGKKLALILKKIKKLAQPGVSTCFLDEAAFRVIKEAGGEPAFLNFENYPASICVSINNEVVHGLPSDDRTIKKGDLVSIDIGMRFKGFCTDAAISFPIGGVSEQNLRLIRVTRLALEKGIEKTTIGRKIGDVQAAIQTTVESAGFALVRDLTGHGIGKNLQEPPSIPNFGKRNTGFKLAPGLVFAIEPMATTGDGKIKLQPDGWTIATLDGRSACHFEKTIAITSRGTIVLTPW